MKRGPKKKVLTGKAAKSSGKYASATGKTSSVAGSRTPGPAEIPAGLGERRLVFGICIFLAAIVWLVFGQTVHFAFVNYDDNLYLYENPAVMGGLSLDGVKWAFTHTVASNWHPLTMLSHMLDWQLYGPNAGGHHLTNVLLHTATVILLFLTLRQMTGNLWRSAMVAAVFAIHPLRAESVAWVSERKDVLSGLFFMLTLWAYARYARHSFSFGRYLCVAALFALGLLSKPMLVTLPFVLLLLDYWPLGRFQWTTFRDTLRALRPLFLEKVPLFLLAAVLSIVTLSAQENSRIALESLPAAIRFSNVLVSYGVYVWEMVWPRHLAAFYPFLPVTPAGQIAGAGVLLLAMTVLAVWAARRRAYLLVGWFWYVGMLVPVIGIVQVGLQSHADRYTYLPQIGLYLLLTWGVADWCAGWRHCRVVLGGVSATVLIALIFCARAQVSHWRNSEALWTHTLACTADNDEARINFGNALLHADREDEAMVQFQQALQINPRNDEAQNNLGYVLYQMGRYQEAMVQFQRRCKSIPVSPKPISTSARCCFKRDDGTRQWLNSSKRCKSILATWKPATISVTFFSKQGGIKRRWFSSSRRCKSIPATPTPNSISVTCSCSLGRADEGVVHYQRALQLNPSSVKILDRPGLGAGDGFTAALRNGRQAVELAERANQIAGVQDPILLRTLAAAYAEDGRFDDAVRSAQSALALARATGKSDLAGKLDSQLKLYEAKQPFHQESNRFEN